MQTITLPHCTQFAYCNGFIGPITELLPEPFREFDNPYQAFLNPQEQNSSRPYFNTKQVYLGSICVDIKHSMGLCEGLDQGDQDVLLTEYTVACPVTCKSQLDKPSGWTYYQSHYQMHSVQMGLELNSNHLSPKDRAELNEDLFLRELGYECLELKQFEVVKNLIAMGHDAAHFKELRALLQLYQALKAEDNPSPQAIETQLNDRHCWESLCLVLADGDQALAHYILKHFCNPSSNTEKLQDPGAIEHLESCLEKACTAPQDQEGLIKNEANGPDLDSLASLSTYGDFPCKDCVHALEHLGHSSLAHELRALQGLDSIIEVQVSA